MMTMHLIFACSFNANFEFGSFSYTYPLSPAATGIDTVDLHRGGSMAALDATVHQYLDHSVNTWHPHYFNQQVQYCAPVCVSLSLSFCVD
jgi:hypothetical protein